MQVVAELEPLPVDRARAGEAAAWEVLFRRYQRPLYAYVYELVHDEQVGLDVVQETFIAAARHIGGLQADTKFGSWLFGIAHQKCLQHWRRQNRESGQREERDGTECDFETSPAELLIRQEQEVEFMELLNQLPVPQRSVLLLHFIEDFSLEEIAGITETTLGTVKSRMHYAKKALRTLLEENA